MKQYHRYQMDFNGKAARYSCVFMGIPIFLLAVYYIILSDYSQIPLGTKIVSLWLPLILCLIYIILLRLIQWNAPGVYAILGAVFCLILIIGLFSTGNVLRIILGVFAYVISAGVLILAAGGYLPGRLPAAICFAVILAIRLLCFDLGRVSGRGWILETASLCMIAALLFLPISMIPGKKGFCTDNKFSP